MRKVSKWARALMVYILCVAITFTMTPVNLIAWGADETNQQTEQAQEATSEDVQQDGQNEEAQTGLTDDREDGAALFDICESGRVIKGAEVLFKNRLQPAQGVHQFRTRRINPPKAAGALRDIEFLIETVTRNAAKRRGCVIEFPELLYEMMDIKTELPLHIFGKERNLIGSCIRCVIVQKNVARFILKEKLFQRHLMIHGTLSHRDIRHRFLSSSL